MSKYDEFNNQFKHNIKQSSLREKVTVRNVNETNEHLKSQATIKGGSARKTKAFSKAKPKSTTSAVVKMAAVAAVSTVLVTTTAVSQKMNTISNIDLNIRGSYIEYVIEVDDLKTDDKLVVKLQNSDYEVSFDIDEKVEKGCFEDLKKETSYELKILKNEKVIRKLKVKTKNQDGEYIAKVNSVKFYYKEGKMFYKIDLDNANNYYKDIRVFIVDGHNELPLEVKGKITDEQEIKFQGQGLQFVIKGKVASGTDDVVMYKSIIMD